MMKHLKLAVPFTKTFPNLTHVLAIIQDIPSAKFIKGLYDLKGHFNVFSFCKLKDDHYFDFDVKKIIMLLEDYINARSSFVNPSGIFKKNPENFYYGISVYDGLARNIERNNNRLDLKAFRLLMEHKKCMLTILDVLGEAGICIDSEIKNEYRQIAELQMVVFNLAIKYELRPSFEIQKRILMKNEYIKEQEKLILSKVILKIKEQYV